MYTLITKDYKHFELRAEDEVLEFEGATLANGCLTGDKVTWDHSIGCRLVERGEHPILVGILELNSKTKYGMTSRGIPMYLFSPSRKEYPNFVVGCSEKILTHNKLVLVRIEDAVPVGRSLPRAALLDIIGPTGDPKAERTAILWNYTPYKMPSAITKLQPKIQDKNRELELRPSTPANTFHIDPPDCRDVDDVISVERVGDIHRIWITISDVAEWVSQGTDIDTYAKKVTATTYENGKPVRPMLPAGYSEDVCSLIPGKKGLGISLIMDWDGKGLDNLMFLKTTVNVRRSYTYHQADADTEGTFDILKKLTTFLSKIEEPNSHDVIEALMILYNREVASILRKKGTGILRRHDAADLDKWEKYKNLNEEVLFLAFKAAEFCNADAQDVYHAGLSSDAYCTATSPIRRYADLVNQRILKVLLSNGAQEIPSPEISVDWLNKRQKELKHYERDIFFISNMLHNDKRIIKSIVLDWSPIKNEEGRFKVQLYIPDWKRFIKWNVSGKPISQDRILCVVQQKAQLFETTIEKSMQVRFEIFWNPQVRNWKEKLVLRVA